MNLTEKEKLVSSLIHSLRDKAEITYRRKLLNGLAYSELRELQSVGLFAEIGLDEMELTLLGDLDDYEKIKEALGLLEFELEADFDEAQLYLALKTFFKHDLSVIADIERTFPKILH